MNSVWFTAAYWAAHKKAIAAFLSTAVAEASALVALGVLNGQTAHNVALVIAALGPVFAFFGVKAGPENVPKP